MKHFCHDPVKLQIELSSMCNAMCLGCVRTDQKSFNNVKDCIPNKEMISLKTFKNMLIAPAFGAVDFIDFCGTIDDPMMHPDIIEMLEFAAIYNHRMSVSLHTNGSLRKPSDWRKLAITLRKFSRDHRVVFSIDGLSDTNSIYRQNTSFTKIMKNVSAFIQAGGIAVWQFIKFPWNEHQIDQAKKLSADMEFARFDLKEDRTDISSLGLDAINERKQKNKKSVIKQTNLQDLINSFTDSNDLEISCNNQKKNTYFISHDSRIWPCCFIPNGFYKNDLAKQEFLNKRIYEEYGQDFNDMTKNSVNDILEHKFFSNDLVESWNNPVGLGPCGKITRCVETCSIKQLQKNPIGKKEQTWL